MFNTIIFIVKGLVVGTIFCCLFMVSCFICHLFYIGLSNLFRIIFIRPKEIILYECDPSKNKQCKKGDHCYLNGGPCHLTRHKELSKEEKEK